MDEEDTCISGEMRLKDVEEEQVRVKAEEEARIFEELRLNAEAGGFCGAGVER